MGNQATTSNVQDTKVITGRARLSYAHIWQPHAMKATDEPKYSCSLIIPKSDKQTIQKIKAAIEAAKIQGISQKWNGKLPANLKITFRDGDTERPDDENYRGCMFLNTSSKSRPGVVDRSRQEILDPEEVYSGCYVLASVNFYPFNSNGGLGVAAGLNNLMKVAEGEPLGGRQSAERDFEGIEVEYDDDYGMLG